jgi:Taurine catabolism dioxygenase TauD, TfdA family
VVQSTQIGAANSRLRGQPAEVVAAAVASLRAALAAHLDGAGVRLRGAMGLVSCAADRACIEGRARVGEQMGIATEPQFACQHEWRSNDLVIWGNRRTMHSRAALRRCEVPSQQAP